MKNLVAVFCLMSISLTAGAGQNSVSEIGQGAVIKLKNEIRITSGTAVVPLFGTPRPFSNICALVATSKVNFDRKLDGTLLVTATEQSHGTVCNGLGGMCGDKAITVLRLSRLDEISGQYIPVTDSSIRCLSGVTIDMFRDSLPNVESLILPMPQN